MSTFWISTDQLDKDQRKVVEGIPATTSFLLRGPAGSGKTNILLLRAKWLTLKKQSNYCIVVFTKSLRKFVADGCAQYGLDPSCVTTQSALFRRILDEYAVRYELANDFDSDRTMLAGKMLSLVESGRISNTYFQTLLVDEAQDYTDTELLVMRGLSKHLVLAADSRQSIYKVSHSPDLIEKIVGGNTAELQYHYRSGLKLCKVADAILSDATSYPRVQSACHYPETERPSSVTPVPCVSAEEQFSAIADNLDKQLALYPGERIGVLFPKREQVAAFNEYASHLGLSDKVWVDTLHAAKGWEFRAVHLGGCEVLYRMGPTQKRLIYTGVLRGKTSAHIYYSGHIPGYLEAALAVIEPPPADPTFDSLFGAP